MPAIQPSPGDEPAREAPPGAGTLRAGLLRVVDAGIPQRLRSDADALRRARILLSFTLVLIVLGLETSVFFAWALPPEAALRIHVSLVAALLLTLCIPPALRRGAPLELGVNLLLAGSLLVMLSAFSVLGGLRAPLLHWCALLPMLAVLMGVRRSAWAWAALGLATVAAFAVADARGLRFPDHLRLADLDGALLWMQRLVDTGSWLAILSGVALLYEAHRVRQTRELAAKNRELESEIEQRRRAEERTQYLAYYDELTTLPNRRLFRQQLERAIAKCERAGEVAGVLLLDLDGFKQVNDGHGHALGDGLLQQVAERLRSCVRNADTVARAGADEPEVVSRLGGDEFTVLLVGIRDHLEAALVARRILRCLEPPFAVGGQEVYIGASIGIALHPGSARDVDELLRNADVAMYHAKQRGKNDFRFFEESMNADLVRRGSLAAALRRGLERGELAVHFQPILALRERRIVGLEALCRWHPPGAAPVPPGEFIAVAEEYGLIGALGAWVLEEACGHFAKWRAAGLEPGRLAVNVSAVQLRRGAVVEPVGLLLRRFEMPPGSLELEVTEGAVLTDEEEASRCLSALKQLGVRIALDDFGTGYSSLRHVKRLPVDALKIDRSFVSGIESDSEAQAIVTAIIAMGKQLRLRVVGEGVETRAQESFLRVRGCDEVQGFRFGRPANAEATFALLLQARRGDFPEEPESGPPAA
jgi:diguanylate cyclase (GGDEF)-like protein